jgi:hypothetical protein
LYFCILSGAFRACKALAGRIIIRISPRFSPPVTKVSSARMGEEEEEAEEEEEEEEEK